MNLYQHSADPAVRYYDLYSRFQDVDVEFFVEEAQRADGPVLELACGNGRLLLPIAQAGVEITGLDLSGAMLDVARRKLAEAPDEVRQRVTLHQGDMSDFSLDERFKLIFIAFNTFLALAEEGAQRRALEIIHRHLADDGRLIISIFDPNLQIINAYLGPGAGNLKQQQTFTDPESGNAIILWDARRYDLAAQTIEQDFIFEELDERGRSLSRTRQSFTLRWLYRYEMEHLLELCGFAVEALYGDFERGPFQPGQHQVWVARKHA